MMGEFLIAIFNIRWNGKYFNGRYFYLDKYILQIQENWAGRNVVTSSRESLLITQAKMRTEINTKLTDGSVLANRNSANHPHCFLSKQKKVQILAFCMWSVKGLYHALLPKTDHRDKGRGHDRRLWFTLMLSPTNSPFFPVRSARRHSQ